MANTVYLLTGANRGIGLRIATKLLARPNTTLVAAVRSESSANTLKPLPTGDNSRLVIIYIDSSKPETAAAAISSLQKEHEVAYLDIVIANAAIADYYGKAAETPFSESSRHFEINVNGVLALFQATLPLLKKSESGNPKFVGISSKAGSLAIADKIPLDNVAYGASKAALNYVLRKCHSENEWLTAFSLDPGWVDTDMGMRGAVLAGVVDTLITVEQSASGVLEVTDKATRAAAGGTFLSYDGSSVDW